MLRQDYKNHKNDISKNIFKKKTEKKQWQVTMQMISVFLLQI